MVKKRLDIGSSVDDDRLNALIAAADKIVRGIACRPLLEEASRVEFVEIDGCGRNSFALDLYPVTSIASIHVSTAFPRVYDATTLISSDRYVITGRGRDRVIRLDGGIWPNTEDCPQSVRVVYTGGYSTGPEDLEHIAVIPIIQTMLTKGKERLYHFTTAAVDNDQIQGIWRDDIPPAALEMILRYKRWDC